MITFRELKRQIRDALRLGEAAYEANRNIGRVSKTSVQANFIIDVLKKIAMEDEENGRQ